MKIRGACIEDAPRILEIYSYYVTNTAITFEYDTPTLAEFENRMKNIMPKYPYIVIELDGIVEGYAYAGPLNTRAAYDRSCEVTIYLNHEVRGGGLGRKLYEELEHRLKEIGILNLYACIGYPIVNDKYLSTHSADFHAHLGYSEVGHFHECGYKFGNWYDMIWMEKIIGYH